MRKLVALKFLLEKNLKLKLVRLLLNMRSLYFLEFDSEFEINKSYSMRIIFTT